MGHPVYSEIPVSALHYINEEIFHAAGFDDELQFFHAILTYNTMHV